MALQRQITRANDAVVILTATAVATSSGFLRRASGAAVTRNADGMRKFDKVKSTGRIDGLQTLAMAFSLALIKNVKPINVEALIG